MMATLSQLASGGFGPPAPFPAGRVTDRARRIDPNNYGALASQFNSYDTPHQYQMLDAYNGGAANKLRGAILKANPTAFGGGADNYGNWLQGALVNGGGAGRYNAKTQTFYGDAGGTGGPDNYTSGGTPTVSPTGVPATLGAMSGATTPQPSSGAPTMTTGGSPNFNEATGNYTGGMDLSNYLDPSYKFARDEGLNAVKNSYAANGNFLSGPAMKGIADYASGTALNKAWQPAFTNYMVDKNFNYGVDSGDRNFAYNAQVGDRNFNQGNNLALAQLGMQGTQSQAGLQQMLAALLSNNTLAAGQAQGAGAVGQGNTVTNAISQILAQLMGNKLVNGVTGG